MQVSVITPLFNAEAWIADAIRSLQAQTCPDWELIVVDDQSSDRSLEMVRRFADTDHRITVLQLEKNSGAATARNVAIEAARYRYIAFLDSDDVWLPKKLEQQIGFMQDRDAALSFTAYEKMDEHGVPYQVMGVPPTVSYADLLKPM